MKRVHSRVLCAFIVSLLYVTLFAFASGQVSAQSNVVAPSVAPDSITQAITVWVPIASSNATLAGSVSVTTALDSAQAVSNSIPPSGGVLTATGAGGDKFTLTIPNGALVVTTTVTLTPVTSISGMPFGELVAGVQIAPANLGLWQAATLRIESKPAVAVADQLSVSWFGEGSDFHFYPLTLDPATVEFSVQRFQGYALATIASANVAAVDAADQSPGASWTPIDILANIAQRMQGVIQQMRQDALANRPSSPQLLEQVDKLLRESWTQAIQPLLQPMTVSCDTAEASMPIVLGWLRQVQLLGHGEDYEAEARQIAWAVIAALENCISEAAEPCLLMQDKAQVEEILGYIRLLQLLGEETEINLEELPKCQEIHVSMGGDRTKQFNIAPDPESAWETKALYIFDDTSAAGVLLVNPFGMFGTGVSGLVTIQGRFGETWRPLSIFNDRWLCRDKADERIDAMIVEIADVTYADAGVSTPPVPFYLHVSKVGCWRWSIEQSYDDEYTENPNLDWTREWTLDATLQFTGTKPFAMWDSVNRQVNLAYNPLKFELLGDGTFDYAMSYVYSSEEFSCQSSLTAHKTPPVAHDDQFSRTYNFDIDESLPTITDITGLIEIRIDQPYQGNCSAWQTPLQQIGVSPATSELGASGRSSSGTDNGYLGEQSGVWNTSWTYTALRQ